MELAWKVQPYQKDLVPSTVVVDLAVDLEAYLDAHLVIASYRELVDETSHEVDPVDALDPCDPGVLVEDLASSTYQDDLLACHNLIQGNRSEAEEAFDHPCHQHEHLYLVHGELSVFAADEVSFLS